MKDKIISIAQLLIQQRGVNGFSYVDIAKELGVSKPSLHHHFATKSALIARVMENYTDQLIDYLNVVTKDKSTSKEQLKAYCELYRQSLNSKRICLGGMLSAEVTTLDSSIQPLLMRFFDYQHKWLTDVIEQGVHSGELQLNTSIKNQATIIIAILQGSLIMSRASKTNELFDQSIEGLFSSM